MKRLIRRISRIADEPIMFFYYAASKIAKGKLFNLYSRKSNLQGFSALKFVISFDCDTLQDIQVVEEVNRKLTDLGITPVYAVPGELLLEGREVYRRVLDTGAEFINHGYRIHSVREGNQYQSSFDYKDISFSEAEADIIQGHKAVMQSLGISPRGFRTPHFGNFQKRSQLKCLHNVLKSLSYDYSTSTIPYFGFRYGAYFKRFEITEIPVSGLMSEPLRIYDSFLFFDNCSGKLNGERYYQEGLKIAKYYRDNVKYGLINIYADPSQIYDCDKFFRVMKEFSEFALCTTYSKLVDEIEGKH